VLLAALRANGIAARLASGFLWEGDLDPGERHVAEGAMHAWVEAYLPGAGWVGIDPTNGVLCDHHAICTAAGLVAEDVSPVQGTYYSKSPVTSSLRASVKVEALRE
jgi:transglutaminase-like putative cysteine protease